MTTEINSIEGRKSFVNVWVVEVCFVLWKWLMNHTFKIMKILISFYLFWWIYRMKKGFLRIPIVWSDHFVIRNAQADKVNTTHLIFVGRTHLGVFFLWLCYHSSAWWLVSCTSWGQVPIWFWSTFYLNIDIVYPCCCKSQCWDVYSSQNIGGVWRGQFFRFVKL